MDFISKFILNYYIIYFFLNIKKTGGTPVLLSANPQFQPTFFLVFYFFTRILQFFLYFSRDCSPHLYAIRCTLYATMQLATIFISCIFFFLFSLLTTIHYSLTTNLTGRLVDRKTGRPITLTLTARTYPLSTHKVKSPPLQTLPQSPSTPVLNFSR